MVIASEMFIETGNPSWKLIKDDNEIPSSVVNNRLVLDFISYNSVKCESECKLKFGTTEAKCLTYGEACIKNGTKCLLYNCIKYDKTGKVCLTYGKDCITYDCLAYGKVCTQYSNTEKEWQTCLTNCNNGNLPITEINNKDSIETKAGYATDYSLSDSKATIIKVGFASDIYSYENDSAIIFIDNEQQCNVTLLKWNGVSYVLAPDDIWVNGKEHGAYDYDVTEDTFYQYVMNCINPIIFKDNAYFIDDNTYYDVTKICTDSVCSYEHYDKQLKVSFTGIYDFVNGYVYIDPSFVDTYTSSSSLLLGNRTESTVNGVRSHAPVLYMNFDKQNESTYFQDNSIYNNYGTITGTSPMWLPSKRNTDGVSYFDADDKIVINNGFDYQYGAISYWINMTSSAVGNSQGVFTKVGNAAYASDCVFLDYTGSSGTNTHLRFYVANQNTPIINFQYTGLNFYNAGWVHVVVMVNSSGNHLYINGAKVTPTYTTGSASSIGWLDYPASNTRFTLGCRENAGSCTEYLDTSELDDFMIWDRPLGEDEITQLYQNGASRVKKYANYGTFTPGVFYNESSIYWNVTFSHSAIPTGNIADANGINLSNPNLMAYYPLDGDFNDALGINNGYCFNSSRCPNNASGVSSSAMRFDGVNSGINISTSTRFDVRNLTISSWIYSTSYSSLSMLIFSKGNVNTQYNLFVHSSGTLYFRTYNGAGSNDDLTVTLANAGITANNWNHIVASYNGTNKTIYVNGILKAINPYTQTLKTGQANQFIGKYNDGTYPANGIIDEVAIFNSSITQSGVLQLYKSGLSQKANTNVTIQTRTASTYNLSDANLVAFWSFFNISSVVDELGVHNGSYENGSVSNSSNGIIGKGAFFDGTNDYIKLNVNNQTTFANSRNLTISAWIYPVEKTASESYSIYCASKEGTSGYVTLALTVSSGNLVTYNSVCNHACSFKTGTVPISTYNWHHIALTYSGSVFENIYLDGTLLSSTTTGIPFSANPNSTMVRIGAYRDNLLPFNGLIDELRTYNRSLTASEIYNLYEMGSYHITDWSSWNTEMIVNDGQPITTSTQGKFMQFKANLYTNTTDVGPYVFNYISSYHPPPYCWSYLTATVLFIPELCVYEVLSGEVG